MVPTDKTTNYIAFICKHFCGLVIAKQVELRLDNTINTCSEIDDTSKDEIITTNIDDLKSKFSISLYCRGELLFIKYVLATKNA